MEFEPKGGKFKRWKTHAMDHMVTMVGFIGDERVNAEIFD
jgi:hypothetical protein